MKKTILALVGLFTFFAAPLALASCSGNAGNVIQSSDRNIVSISIKEGTLPDRIQIGHFDEAGIVLVVSYSDQSSEEIPLTESFLPEAYREKLHREGVYDIVIAYRGQQTTIRVTMVDLYEVRFYAYVDETPEYALVSTQYVTTGLAASDVEVTESFRHEGVHYYFAGWDKAFNDIRSDLDVYARYDVVNYYTVSFYDGANNLIGSQWVDEGQDATEPTAEERAMEGYEFVGWDRPYSNVVKDIDVYGIYVTVTESPVPSPASNHGWRSDDPFTVAEILNQEPNSTKFAYVEGYVNYISAPFDAFSGTISFCLADTPFETDLSKSFHLYAVSWPESIPVGAKVTAKGYIYGAEGTVAFNGGEVLSVTGAASDDYNQDETCWQYYAAESFSSGDGSESNPFLISTPEELARLSKISFYYLNTQNYYFALANELDMSGHEWIPIGRCVNTDWMNGGFRGHFDGRGFSIRNLYISRKTVDGFYNGNYIGLFGWVWYGEVKNVNVVDYQYLLNFDVNEEFINRGLGYRDHLYIGGVIGESRESQPVENCSSSGICTFNNHEYFIPDVGVLF